MYVSIVKVRLEKKSIKRNKISELKFKINYCSWVLLHFVIHLLGPHLRHLEVPGLGVESELQLLACAQQCRSQATFTTYITAHGNSGSLIH